MNRSHLAAGCAALTCVAFLLASCMEELENTGKIGSTTFKPEIGIPLVNSTFTMEEFLTEGGSKARVSEQSGVMVLTYDDSLYSPNAESVFILPDQKSPVISITGAEVSFPSPGSSVTISKSITFAFNTLSGDALDSIQIKTGRMLFSLASTFPSNVDVTISIPSLKQQGIGFQKNASFAGAGTLSPSADLQASTLDLTVGGTTSNTVTFAIVATITDTGVPIDDMDRLSCSFDMEDLGFSALFGNVKTRNFSLSTRSINVDIFGNGSGGSIAFQSAVVRLDINNDFGMPVGFDIQNIAVKEEDESTIALTGPAVSAPANPYLIDGPSYAQTGQSVSTEIAINSGNSNMEELFSTLPYYLEYGFGVVLDPLDNAQDFVFDDSRLAVGVHLELPFHGKLAALTISREYDFDGLGIDDIQEGLVSIKTINELPLDAAVQVYFVDASGTVLDSLFANPSIIKGAQVNSDGFAEGHAEVISEVPVLQEKVDRINQAEQLMVRAVLHTTDQGAVPVKFAAEDKLQISIGLRAKVPYELN